ncbi:MAG: hypothetical protein ABIJ34_09495 [archaeon]
MDLLKSNKPNQPPVPVQDNKPVPEKFITLQNAAPTTVAKQLEEIMRRLRLLEERYSGLRKKSQFVEQSMLRDVKDLFEEIHALTDSLSELRSQMSELTEKLGKLTEEVKESVDKSELHTLAKYMDFWQPLDFITRKEVERMISERKL